MRCYVLLLGTISHILHLSPSSLSLSLSPILGLLRPSTLGHIAAVDDDPSLIDVITRIPSGGLVTVFPLNVPDSAVLGARIVADRRLVPRVGAMFIIDVHGLEACVLVAAPYGAAGLPVFDVLSGCGDLRDLHVLHNLRGLRSLRDVHVTRVKSVDPLLTPDQ